MPQKSTPAEDPLLAALHVTLSERQISRIEAEFDAISAGVKDLEKRWAAHPPTREQLDGTGFELVWCELFVRFQRNYTAALDICKTDGDMAVMAHRVLGDSLDAHAEVLKRIFSWPMGLKTRRTLPAKVERESAFSPILRQRLLEAAARKPEEKKPEGAE